MSPFANPTSPAEPSTMNITGPAATHCRHRPVASIGTHTMLRQSVVRCPRQTSARSRCSNCSCDSGTCRAHHLCRAGNMAPCGIRVSVGRGTDMVVRWAVPCRVESRRNPMTPPTRPKIIEALLDRHGRTFASEARIRLARNTPATTRAPRPCWATLSTSCRSATEVTSASCVTMPIETPTRSSPTRGERSSSTGRRESVPDRQMLQSDHERRVDSFGFADSFDRLESADQFEPQRSL